MSQTKHHKHGYSHSDWQRRANIQNLQRRNRIASVIIDSTPPNMFVVMGNKVSRVLKRYSFGLIGR